MELDRYDLTFVILYLDLLGLKYEIGMNGFVEMLARVDIALGRTVGISRLVPINTEDGR